MIYNIELYSRVEAAFGFVAANAISAAETQLVKSNINSFSAGDRTFADLTLNAVKSKKEFKFSVPSPSIKQKGINAVLDNVGFKNSNGTMSLAALPPMVSFSREKNISKTVIDNSDYEVIENFGKKSWNIQLEGIIVDVENHWYPEELERMIVEMFDVDEILEVTSRLFANKGIKSIYFDRLDDLSFVEGFNDTMKYKLTAYSTHPTEFLLLSGS